MAGTSGMTTCQSTHYRTLSIRRRNFLSQPTIICSRTSIHTPQRCITPGPIPIELTASREVLSNGRSCSVANMMRLQNDDLSIPARILVPLLTGLPLTDPLALKARDLVVDWNYVLDRNSVPAGIYTMWQRRLQANVRDLLVPKEAQGFVTLAMKRIIDWLITPDARFGADPVRGRNELLVRSFEEATAELSAEARA